MTVKQYYHAIVDTLQGRTEELRHIPPECLDWEGPGAMLRLIKQTSGKDRTTIIAAIGLVIRDHAAPPAVLAQLVQIVSALDLAEVEPQLRSLHGEPVALQEPLKSAMTNYFAYRNLNFLPATEEADRSMNGKIKKRKSRSDHSVAPKSA